MTQLTGAPTDFAKQAGRQLNADRRAVQNASAYDQDDSPNVTGIQAYPDRGPAFPVVQEVSGASSE